MAREKNGKRNAERRETERIPQSPHRLAATWFIYYGFTIGQTKATVLFPPVGCFYCHRRVCEFHVHTPIDRACAPIVLSIPFNRFPAPNVGRLWPQRGATGWSGEGRRQWIWCMIFEHDWCRSIRGSRFLARHGNGIVALMRWKVRYIVFRIWHWLPAFSATRLEMRDTSLVWRSKRFCDDDRALYKLSTRWFQFN